MAVTSSTIRIEDSDPRLARLLAGFEEVGARVWALLKRPCHSESEEYEQATELKALLRPKDKLGIDLRGELGEWFIECAVGGGKRQCFRMLCELGAKISPAFLEKAAITPEQLAKLKPFIGEGTDDFRTKEMERLMKAHQPRVVRALQEAMRAKLARDQEKHKKIQALFARIPSLKEAMLKRNEQMATIHAQVMLGQLLVAPAKGVDRKKQMDDQEGKLKEIIKYSTEQTYRMLDCCGRIPLDTYRIGLQCLQVYYNFKDSRAGLNAALASYGSRHDILGALIEEDTKAFKAFLEELRILVAAYEPELFKIFRDFFPKKFYPKVGDEFVKSNIRDPEFSETNNRLLKYIRELPKQYETELSAIVVGSSMCELTYTMLHEELTLTSNTLVEEYEKNAHPDDSVGTFIALCELRQRLDIQVQDFLSMVRDLLPILCSDSFKFSTREQTEQLLLLVSQFNHEAESISHEDQEALDHKRREEIKASEGEILRKIREQEEADKKAINAELIKAEKIRKQQETSKRELLSKISRLSEPEWILLYQIVDPLQREVAASGKEMQSLMEVLGFKFSYTALGYAVQISDKPLSTHRAHDKAHRLDKTFVALLRKEFNAIGLTKDNFPLRGARVGMDSSVSSSSASSSSTSQASSSPAPSDSPLSLGVEIAPSMTPQFSATREKPKTDAGKKESGIGLSMQEKPKQETPKAASKSKKKKKGKGKKKK